MRLHTGSRSSSRAVLTRRAAVLALLCLSMLSSTAWASGLQVSPILVEFDPAQQAQGLRLTNTGSEPLRAQVRLQQWSQEDREDHLAPTRALVASPSILEIAPGEQQLVRLVRLQPAPTAQEQSFRVLVDELPDEDSAQARPGLQFLLRYSIPVFVRPVDLPNRQPPEPQATALTDLAAVRIHLEPGDAGGTRLVVANDGRQRVRISQLDIVGTDGARKPINQGLLGYVLSGRVMAWSLPHSLQPGQTFEARFNDDEHAQALPLDGAGR